MCSSHPDAGAPLTAVRQVAIAPFVALIWVYKLTLSPVFGGQCRYWPTCSNYALDAYRSHGAIRGTRLTVSRLLRCHPLSRGGYDPVPVKDCEGAR